MELDEIIYNAINASEAVSNETAGRIYSTCIEVPPTEDDNTPLPYIVITDGGYTNELGTKDYVWEGATDHCKASVIVSANSPAEVKRLRRLIRQAIELHVVTMAEPPMLTASNNDGVAWDWTKPCYYDTLHYQCDMEVLTEDNNE